MLASLCSCKSAPVRALFRPKGHVLDAVAARHGAPLATVALAWLPHQPVVTSVILGAKRLDQLEGQLGAADLALSANDLAALDAASALASEDPVWMLRAGDAGRQALRETGRLPNGS